MTPENWLLQMATEWCASVAPACGGDVFLPDNTLDLGEKPTEAHDESRLD